MKKLIERIKDFKDYVWIILLIEAPLMVLGLIVDWEFFFFMNLFVIFGSFFWWIVIPFVSNILDKLTPAEAIGRIIGRYWYIFLALIILIILLNN